eukprot:TRINITY_DN1463_c0_g1_i1.p1 TRINITY_DN1463_c0_g1~~TRINITY_DN1463_c0_g1_i1.p1  ORF type:complete len:354 (-),score=56.37 TRINITY_DN1463_c0_g1_i1:105-1166(-)
MEEMLVHWFSVFMNEGLNENGILDFKTLLNMTLVSRSLSNVVRGHIELNHCFVLTEENKNSLQYYTPRNQKEISHPNQISPSTTKARFTRNFNEEIKLTAFTNLSCIEFDHTFNNTVDNVLPPNLTHLTLSFTFTQPLNNLPKTLTHLTMGGWWNESVSNLPENLTELILSDYFNQPIEALPRKITHLTFRSFFNQPVAHLLPPNLVMLKFGNDFNKEIHGLPQSLEILCFGSKFNQSVDGLLPPNLKSLEFGHLFCQSVTNLPRSLTFLKFGVNFDMPVDSLALLPNLTRVEFGEKFQQTINRLPPCIKEVYFHKAYSHSINHLLSPSIKFQTKYFDRFHGFVVKDYQSPNQ